MMLSSNPAVQQEPGGLQPTGIVAGTDAVTAGPASGGQSVADSSAPPAPRPDFAQSMLAIVPGMWGFALSLCGNSTTADDMVQDALIKAWEKQALYQPGTNLRAWLFTILRNEYFSKLRKYRREVEDADGLAALQQVAPADQSLRLDVLAVAKALQELPAAQREALILVGAGEFSYEEAAEIVGCKVGTIKSRVNRGREALTALLNFDDLLGDADGSEEAAGQAARR